MGALDQLRKEHQVILRVAQRMEEAVCGRTDRPASEAFLRAAVDFVRVYADANHHGKEEGALFEMMRRNPRLAGMAAVLAEEHVDGRAMIGGLEQALDAHQDEAVRHAALTYVSYIRAHIAKEDGMIFDAAENELTAGEAAELDRAFADVEADALGTGGLSRLLARLDATALRAPTGA
jgi:hemerythrin-like domain-containing protein